MSFKRDPLKWLSKKARSGARGYPVGTIAYYGPDDRRAAKLTASILAAPDQDPTHMRRWFSDTGDLRKDETALAEVIGFFKAHEVHSVGMAGIIGCPHEEGVDYAQGQDCPQCPFWAGKDGLAALRGG